MCSKRFLSLVLGIVASTFVACNGGGGGASSDASTPGAALVPTVPPPTVSGITKAPNDESPTVPAPDGNGFVKLNSVDEGARGTITLKGQSD